MWLQAAPPVMARLLDEPVRETTVVDVLLGALGLTAVLLLIAAVLGAVAGGLFILFRIVQARRREYIPEAGADVPRIVQPGTF
jgi:hypothetical protein